MAPCFCNLNRCTRSIGNPRQANLLLHGAWCRTPKTCHRPWNVESTIRKAKLLKHNAKFKCILKTGGYLQLRNFIFLHYTISFWNHFRPCWLLQSPWFIQFFSHVSTARLIGIPYQAIFFPILYISIKNRQIAAQSVRFAVHNRFIIVGCRLP